MLPQAQKIILVDTNILFLIVTERKKECDISHWRKLVRFIDDKKFRLLLPDVVRMELGIEYQKMSAGVKIDIDRLKPTAPPNVKFEWNEVEHLREQLAEKLNKEIEKSLNQIKEEVLKGWTERSEEISKWLDTSPNVEKAPLTDKILMAAKRRLISGRYPKKPKDNIQRTLAPRDFIENDCCVMESAIDFFREHGIEEKEFLLCTENVSDFGISEVNTIHPYFKDDLPSTQLFSTLQDLVEFLEKNLPVVTPSPEKVSAAIEREKVLNTLLNKWIDSPPTNAIFPEEQQIILELVKHKGRMEFPGGTKAIQVIYHLASQGLVEYDWCGDMCMVYPTLEGLHALNSLLNESVPKSFEVFNGEFAPLGTKEVFKRIGNPTIYSQNAHIPNAMEGIAFLYNRNLISDEWPPDSSKTGYFLTPNGQLTYDRIFPK